MSEELRNFERDGSLPEWAKENEVYWASVFAQTLELARLEEAGEIEGVYVFHAGTRREESGRVLSNGGRVLGVTGTGATIREAIDTAYRGVDKIRFPASQFRRDIGYRACRKTGTSGRAARPGPE